jgi:hypothetical protein
MGWSYIDTASTIRKQPVKAVLNDRGWAPTMTLRRDQLARRAISIVPKYEYPMKGRVGTFYESFSRLFFEDVARDPIRGELSGNFLRFFLV